MERSERLERNDSPGLTPAEGRRFAFTVGGAFLVFAAVFGWRGHSSLLAASLVLGGSLLLAGLLLPGRLAPLRRAWMKLAHLISRVTNPLVMGIIYYIVITPIGGLRRILGGNPLSRRDTNGSFWVARRDGGVRKDMHRQF